MSFAKIEGDTVVKYPVVLETEFPNTSFGYPISQETLPDGYYIVVETPQPTVGNLEKLQEGTPEKIANAWTQVWSVIDMTTEEQAAVTSDAWDQLRRERDVRLSLCDWTQLSDAPLTTEDKALWVTYRQELRDLPTNTTDPFNPVWPTPPDDGTIANSVG